MALKRSFTQLSRSLYFKILAPIVPIIALMAFLGSAIFSLGLSTASHYANERILEDLERNSREIYNICDSALQGLLLEGHADAAAIIRVRKGITLGKIEDYAQQNNLQIIVYTDAGNKLLLSKALIAPQKIITATQHGHAIAEIDEAEATYYARRFQFELWEWDIVLVKDGKFYAEFVSKIKQSYYAISGILLIVSLMLILYFRRVIHKPIRSIITSIQANSLPDYKGIYEFEFLSNTIRQATIKEQLKQAQISYQASHDALTGLINRREFERRLETILDDVPFKDAQHSVLYLDLDQFKIINDTCGHNGGDALLQQLTSLLQEQLRQNDVLARLGGDEFGVLLENCPGKPALRIAESLLQIVSDYRFFWKDKSFSVGVSIGLATFGNDGLSLNDIFSIVDGACYVAKDKGRNRIHVYHADDNELTERKGQMNWVGRITRALEDNRIVLYKQKIIPLQHSSHNCVHFEVLVRMLDEAGELIPPMTFIPAAERYNLMSAIDFRVIQVAFEYFAQHCHNAEATYTCAINLSGATLGNEKLLPYIREQFRLFDVPPQAICFEITETVAIAKLSIATTLIRELKQIGCRFALDDFGSGMSSFGYLKNLPVDFIKIDGGFVCNLINDPIDHAMVDAINNIGHVMGIKTIAEFVETEAIAAALRQLGVDYAQGYWIGRPEPINSP